MQLFEQRIKFWFSPHFQNRTAVRNSKQNTHIEVLKFENREFRQLGLENVKINERKPLNVSSNFNIIN